MNEQRAEFEAWAQGRHLNLAKIDGMYRSPEVTFAFLAYQSAAQRQQERIAELEAKVNALTLDAACWRWLSEHIEVAWSENGFTSLVRIVSDKHREMLTATVKRMMHGDWSDVHKRQQAQPQAEGEPT